MIGFDEQFINQNLTLNLLCQEYFIIVRINYEIQEQNDLQKKNQSQFKLIRDYDQTTGKNLFTNKNIYDFLKYFRQAGD